MILNRPARLRGLVPALVLLIASLGCSKHATVTAPAVVDTGPVPDTPQHAVDLLQWSWNHRDLFASERLLSDDFVFQLGPVDSLDAGPPVLVDDLIAISSHLFTTGTTTQPPATHIEFDVNTPVATPDTRVGMTFPTHQVVSFHMSLRVETADAVYQISGGVQASVVRGDSAAIAPQQMAAGAAPRADRWYIDRIVDETGSGGALARAAALSALAVPTRHARPNDTLPSKRNTWGQLLLLYR